MPENTDTPVIDYPEKKSRKGLLAALLAALLALAVGGGLLAAHLLTKKDATAHVFTDYCAASPESEFERGKMIYTDGRYLKDNPVQVSEKDGEHWCVIDPEKGDGTLHWVLLYVGVDHPIYKTMLAENGDDDTATRAVLRYQGIPALKFARDGWIGFVTSDTDEPWSDFRAGAGAMLLQRIADQAIGKEVPQE